MNGALTPSQSEMRRARAVRLLPCVALALMWALSSHASAQDIQSGKQAVEKMALENDYVRLSFGSDGTVRTFSRRDGTSLLADPKGAPFMFLRIGQKWLKAITLSCSDEAGQLRLRVTFEGTSLTAQAIVRPHAQYFEVEAVSLEGAGSEAVEQWAFVNLPVNLTSNVGIWLNVAWDDAFAAAVIALEEKTNATGAPTLKAIGHGRLGLSGRKAAIIACPTARMLDIIREIEKEHDLPSPTLGGQWAKTSHEARKSWMITAMAGADPKSPYFHERIFELAKAMGVEYVVISLGTWNSTFGHYTIHARNFPPGVASLKEVADKAHALGLKLGIHVMTASVTKNDAYVTPVPDPRLRKDGEATLAKDVDATAQEILTLESPASFGTASGYWAYRGVDVVIDDEIIRYSDIRDQAPFALTGCKRGAHGTRPASHKAGAKVKHIMEKYGWYVADNDLAAEIGRNLALTINEAGLDMVCFDGADVLSLADPELRFFDGHQVPLSLLRHARRDVLLVSNGTSHFGWHVVTRGGEDDAMARGYKRWVDDVTVHRWAAHHWRSLMVPDFSWVGIFGHTPTMAAARPDDVELVCARSLGYDGVIGWGFAAAFGGPSSAESLSRNGRKDEITNVIRTYEKLRLENYFPVEARMPLREGGTEWRLLPPDSANARYRLTPVRYLKSEIIRPDAPETAAWAVTNDLPAQPLRVRVVALPALAPYGSKTNVVVADFGRLSFDRGGDPAAKVVFEPARERHPQAGEVVRFSCSGPAPDSKFPRQLSGHGRPAWAQVAAKFPEKLNLARHRALGLWIKGDGGGETLNVQLEVMPQSYLHFYQPITFTGWRYCELGEPEGDRVMDYFTYEKFALHDVKLDRFTAITLMILNPPIGKGVELCLGRIEALHEIGGKLEAPQVTVESATLALPVSAPGAMAQGATSLEPEHYLETGDLWGTSNPATCRVFDPNGVELRRFTVEGAIPQVPPGRADLRFKAHGSPTARARVTLILLGSPRN